MNFSISIPKNFNYIENLTIFIIFGDFFLFGEGKVRLVEAKVIGVNICFSSPYLNSYLIVFEIKNNP